MRETGIKVVLQDGRSDCGICCLLSIIRYYGGEISKEYLRCLTNTTKDGVSAFNLINAACQLGMEAYGVTGEIKNININNLPCIAHVALNASYQHFVVIYKIDNNKITLMDPAIGKRIVSLAEFKLMSTSNYILFNVKKKLPQYNNKKIIINLIHTYIKSNKFNFVLLSFIALNLIILEIVVAFNFKYIMTFSINYFSYKNIIIISSCMILFNIINFFLEHFSKRLLYKVILLFDLEITFNTFKQLLLLPYFYYKNRTVGEIFSRFNDLSVVKNFLVKFLSTFLIDVVSLILFIFFLISINKWLSLIIIVYIFICTFLVFLRSNKKRKMYKQVRKLEDGVNSYIVEALSNVDTMKGNHLEKRFIDRFLLRYKKLVDKNYSYLNYLDFNVISLKLVENILNVLIYGIGGYYVISTKLELSNMIIFVTFFQYFLRTFTRLINLFEELSNYNISKERVEDLYSILPEDFSKSYFFLPYNLCGDIKITNLSYVVDNKKIFNNINLTIHERDKVLLFGSSGSGKSTFVKMLLRYVDIPFSMISIAGIDISHYHLENIRKYISYVSSSELLFNDTIYNNICLYRECSEEEFMKIIKICRVDKIFGDEFDNYKMMIDENGFLLSSGERQRIALARSLVRNSSIYIFDEAFGQIDIDLTNKILSDMFLYLQDRTVIVISHRNNSKKFFNRILKLENGNIYEK